MTAHSSARTSQLSLARRRLLRSWLVTPAALLVAACGAAPPSAPPPAPSAPAASPATVSPAPSAPTTVPAAPTSAPTTPPATATRPAVGAAGTAPTATSAVVAPVGGPVLAPTPTCTDGDEATIAQTEGPYFKPNTPERQSLLTAGMAGTRLLLTGRVRSTACAPVGRALLDFWQCDDKGVYDNSGYTLRGHQFTDTDGRYRLETILPGLYPGRTRHIHVRVQAPNRPVLTTQLYFPNEPGNRADGIFSPKLVVALTSEAERRLASYDFVLRLT